MTILVLRLTLRFEKTAFILNLLLFFTVQGQCRTFTLCFFFEVGLKDALKTTWTHVVHQQTSAGCHCLLCHLFKNVGVSQILSVRDGHVTKSTLSCSCACRLSWRGGCKDQTSPLCLQTVSWKLNGNKLAGVPWGQSDRVAHVVSVQIRLNCLTWTIRQLSHALNSTGSF